MSGFGKEAGPSPDSLSQPRFGPPSSSPSPHPSFPHLAPRGPEAAGRVRSPPLPYQTFPLSTAPNYQSAAIPSSTPGAVETLRSPPLGFTGTDPATSPAFPSIGPPSESPSRWDNGQGPLFKDDAQTNNKDSAVTSFVASRSSGTSLTAKVARFQDLKRARPPPSLSSAQDISRNTSQKFFPRLSPPAWDDQPKLQGNYPNMLTHQDPSFLPYAGSHDSIHATKRTRSPPVSPVTEVFQENIPSVQTEHKRTSMSPPRLGGRSNPLLNASNFPSPQETLPSIDTIADANAARTTGFSMAKRTRSPPFSSVDKFSQGNSYSTQDVAEREMQAKVKRLARFKEELSADFENSRDVADLKVSASGREQAIIERQKFAGGHSIESSDLTNNNISSDFEGSETSSIIIGFCPDMCPESERAERERKGDLDQFERLDGDRNQTNKFLAVKKYNRTAEREAILIRPLPILQNTIDYLLNLLDRPYNDKFLGMYNFLWDRMRAIRMDLRMQHIFSQESITMLEQMIRLHIIAMHELCEYRTGEGSIEGFDAHLNIEQMNKTSVELFQMYDDHRKKGIVVPTEKEFRGYYALLKLDKHPGYKVEPAELSLDLAQMTPEIRQTSEVLFARDVARACRTVNFIAFFRLARKASYLQACLMHAHFAKLRTQALAALHSGLQNSQGLPVALISKWLAMEEEVEELLKYHGFMIKEFEEPYMVKDGPFLNADKDYRTECSKLVHLKKSKRIVDDVIAPSQGTSLSSEAAEETQPPKVYKHGTKPVPSAFVGAQSLASEIDEEVPDFEVVSSPKIQPQVEPMIEEPVVNRQSEDNNLVADANISPSGVSWAYSSPEPQPAKLGVVEKLNHDTAFRGSFKRKMPSSTEVMPLQIVSRKELLERSPSGKYDYNRENSIPQMMVLNNSGDEEPSDINQGSENDEEMENYVDEEVAEAKLKLIIRLWRRRSLKRRELREQRQMTANAALSSLSLGPPIRQTKDQSITVSGFDIDHAMKERYENHERSWSRLNVSDEIADVLGRRNPHAKCLCWKIILCSQLNNQAGDTLEQRSQVMQVAAGSWLCSKLMPSTTYDDNDDGDLLISSPGLAIWRKWLPSQSGNDLNCCLSVVKDVKFDNLNETVAGASAVLFLVSESIAWNLQKTQLHNLLASIPSGSSLPLLVLSGLKCREGLDLSSIIVSELGLQHIDKSRISSFSIIFLFEDKRKEKWDGFFSDMRLREGLRWLASESPLQPDLHCIKTRDLVLTLLNPSLDVLESLSDYEVSPNHCISAFNEALDCSLGKIAAAAKSNPTSWPCPEIALLGNFSDEQMVANWYLPSIGWSLAERIEPLLCTIRNCKLPIFPDAMAWLDKGANMDNEIEDLRSQLENFLIRYLTDSSGMMGRVLATKEAHVMVQSARLELHDSSYYIVPKWTKVFRRIFNWRLTSLSSGVFSSAFVLRCHHVELASRIPSVLQLEGGGSLPYLRQPSLDEVISTSCRPFLSGRDQAHAEAFQRQPRMITSGYVWKDPNMSGLTENQRTSAQNGNLIETENNDHATNQSIGIGAGKVTKDADKLSKLLERCNIVQNSIGKNLSIYF